jgi:WXG100 family type VII secretion target
MSDEVLLKRTDAESIANEMKLASADAVDRFAITRNRLSDLAESFRGNASTAFQARFEQWDEGAKQVVDALDELGVWLLRATETLSDADQQLASGLG